MLFKYFKWSYLKKFYIEILINYFGPNCDESIMLYLSEVTQFKKKNIFFFFNEKSKIVGEFLNELLKNRLKIEDRN